RRKPKFVVSGPFFFPPYPIGIAHGPVFKSAVVQDVILSKRRGIGHGQEERQGAGQPSHPLIRARSTWSSRAGSAYEIPTDFWESGSKSSGPLSFCGKCKV